MKHLRDEVLARRVKSIVPTGSVPYRPQTHGNAEDAVQDIMDQLRKIKIGVESRLKSSIRVVAPIVEWMVERADTIINRHMMGHGGKAPYERVRNTRPPVTQVEFGEQVMAAISSKIEKASRKQPLAKRIAEATWIGINESTIGNIVAFSTGKVVRARAVYRRPVTDRWDGDATLGVRATPMKPDLEKEEVEIPSLTLEEEKDEKDVAMQTKGEDVEHTRA